jgi:hypothetical protein
MKVECKIKTQMRIAGPLALPSNVDTDGNDAPTAHTCNNIVRGEGRNGKLEVLV